MWIHTQPRLNPSVKQKVSAIIKNGLTHKLPYKVHTDCYHLTAKAYFPHLK